MMGPPFIHLGRAGSSDDERSIEGFHLAYTFEKLETLIATLIVIQVFSPVIYLLNIFDVLQRRVEGNSCECIT